MFAHAHDDPTSTCIHASGFALLIDLREVTSSQANFVPRAIEVRNAGKDWQLAADACSVEDGMTRHWKSYRHRFTPWLAWNWKGR